MEIVTIGSKGGDISYNLITYLGNFSREKLKLLTLKLNVTMKHLTIILLGWWTFQMFLGVNNFVNFSQKNSMYIGKGFGKYLVFLGGSHSRKQKTYTQVNHIL